MSNINFMGEILQPTGKTVPTGGSGSLIIDSGYKPPSTAELKTEAIKKINEGLDEQEENGVNFVELLKELETGLIEMKDPGKLEQIKKDFGINQYKIQLSNIEHQKTIIREVKKRISKNTGTPQKFDMKILIIPAAIIGGLMLLG